jgi:hypothetical protein
MIAAIITFYADDRHIHHYRGGVRSAVTGCPGGVPGLDLGGRHVLAVRSDSRQYQGAASG